jgi:DNA polymerase-3 subunit gamma/tau
MNEETSTISFQLKYKAKIFSELVGLESLERQFEYMFRTKWHGNVMFGGPNGHGKSTLADVFLKRMFCENPSGLDACLVCETCLYLLDESWCNDIHKISGAKFTANFEHFEKHLTYVPTKLSRCVGLVEDLDMVDLSLLNKLIDTMDENRNVLILFTVTNAGRMPLPLLQRCRIIKVPKPSYASLETLIIRICQEEQIKIREKRAIMSLITFADQTPRIILSALEMIKGESCELSMEVLNAPSVASNLQQLTGKYACV